MHCPQRRVALIACIGGWLACGCTGLLVQPACHPSRLPPPFHLYSSSFSEDTVAQKQQVHGWLKDFSNAWKSLGSWPSQDTHTNAAISDFVQDYFVNGENVYWRDMVAFTWNIVTIQGQSDLNQAISTIDMSVLDRLTVSPSHPLPPKVSPTNCEFWCDLETTIGSGKAHFRLQRSSSEETWKIKTLLTVLWELKDHPFQVGPNRRRGHIHGPLPNRVYFSDLQKNNFLQEMDEADSPLDRYIVIVGGGQAGLSLSARLSVLDVPHIVLEASDTPGAAWKQRYPSLHLHDPVWYNGLPYLDFPDSWPIFCPRDKIADWLQMYATVMDLPVQTKTKVVSAQQDEESTDWIIEIEERTPETDGNIRRSLRAKHLVFATGNSSHPKMPRNLPGQDAFQGRMIHSSQYRGGKSFSKQRVVVVGSNNSALDIAQDLWEQGAQKVILLQRSPSMVVSTQSVLELGLGPLYSEDAKLKPEDADLVATATPYRMAMDRWKTVTKAMTKKDEAILQGLEHAGFQLDFGPDNAGIFAKSATEGGGFYINMGAAELIMEGSIDVRHAEITRFDKNGIVIASLRDQDHQREEHVPADVVVFATGYDTLDKWVAELCGSDVAECVGRTWGLGLGIRPNKDPGPWLGELRNMWKPTKVPGLWFQGGNLAQNRHYSRFLALQLAARYFGILDSEKATHLFGIPEPTALADDSASKMVQPTTSISNLDQIE